MPFLDAYTLEQVLAERGAVTTRQMRSPSGERVVVKTLSVHAARDAREVTLFEREAGILKHLTHAAVPRFLDYAVEESGADVRLHLVQSHVDGRTLEAWIKDGRSFSAREGVQIMRALADVLCTLHGTSPPLVHRDIKPGNVMMNAAGTVFLVDFGAAKRAAKDGTAVGTFGYMAPEQMEGRASPASDVFGLGMTMVFLLTHLEPEAFADDGGVRKAWRSRANVGDALAGLITDCISLDDAQRPADGRALRDRIDALDRAPVARPAPRPSAAAPRRDRGAAFIAAGGVVVAVVSGLWLALSNGQETSEMSGPTAVITERPIPDVPLAPTAPSRPLVPERIPASVRLGVPGLLEAIRCQSRAHRAIQSEDRYRSWRKGDVPPTCKEAYLSYGLYELYEDAPERCAEAASSATDPALKDATLALSTALTALTPIVAETSSYYEAEDYKDDACAKGQALHAQLLPGFSAVRAAFAAINDARAVVAKSPLPADEEMVPYRRLLDAALALSEPTLPLAGRRAAVDAYQAAVAALPEPVVSIGVNIEGLKKWARGSNDMTGQLSAGMVASSTASAIEMRLTFR